MRKIAPNIWWDGQDRTLFIRRSCRKSDLPGHVAEHRQVLESNPGDVGIRYMLANCLYANGEVEEAQAEWERVIKSGDEYWAAAAQEAMHTMGSGNEPASDAGD